MMPGDTAVSKEVWWEVRSSRRKKNISHSLPENAGSTVSENSVQGEDQEYPRPLPLFCARTRGPRNGLVVDFLQQSQGVTGETWLCSFFRHFFRCQTLCTDRHRDLLTLNPTYLSSSSVHLHCPGLGFHGLKSGFLQEPYLVFLPTVFSYPNQAYYKLTGVVS